MKKKKESKKKESLLVVNGSIYRLAVDPPPPLFPPEDEEEEEDTADKDTDATGEEGTPPQEKEEESKGPSSEEMVKQMEDSPSENWREYLQPIIVSIRKQYGLEMGQVKLLNPTLLGDKFSSPSYGFAIGGHVKFSEHPPDKLREDHGLPPYKFEATVTPDGELISSVKITGSEG